MAPRSRAVLGAALVLVLCHAADQGVATVVRDGKTAANPAVEAGGQHLQPAPPPVFPYSLIGAISGEFGWFPPCVIWPTGLFNGLNGHHHHHAARFIGRLPPR